CEAGFVIVWGTMAERDRLLAAQRPPHRALERARRQHGQRQFILRAQSGSESTSDVGRQHAHFVARHPEHAGNVVAAVLRSLRLVEDGNAVVPSHTAVAPNGSMGFRCSTGIRYSALIRTAACSNARAGSPRATECAGSHFEIAPRLRCASKSVTCGLRSYSTRTSEAANRAISNSSATTSATG